MRVLIVNTRSDVMGGATVHVKVLARGLRRAGHDVTVVVGGSGPIVGYLESSGVSVIAIPELERSSDMRKIWGAVKAVSRCIRSVRPDIVSLHSLNAGVVGRLAAWACDVPAAFTLHGWAFDGPSRYAAQLLEKGFGRITARTVVVSHAAYAEGGRLGVFNEDKTVVVHNGIEDIGKEHRSRPESEPPLIACVARFEAPKAQELLVRALRGCKDLRWSLVFAGDGIRRRIVESAVVECGLEERVQFLGEVADVARVLKAAGVLALLSHSEGFPITVLEGMRAGLPVFASDVGGVREAVIDGETGFLVDNRDVEQQEGRLRELLVRPELRRRMGDAGRLAWEEQFSESIMVAATVREFEKVGRQWSGRG